MGIFSFNDGLEFLLLEHWLNDRASSNKGKHNVFFIFQVLEQTEFKTQRL